MKIKKIVLSLIALSAALLTAACSQTDVVGKIAVTSFDALLTKLGDKVSFNAENNHWVLVSPTGEHFEWSKDFSSNQPDASVVFDAAPFINAGLDLTKLPKAQYQYDEAAGRITMPYELSRDAFIYSKEASALTSFEQIVKTNRKKIGYHAEFDHYGIALGGGNMFEWAKDMSKNDKDIVFVLEPKPLIEAGVDPSKVEGWAFAKVKVEDERGKMIEVDKLLKPFQLD